MLIFSLDTKKCMNALLLHPAFDSFLFIEGDITTFNTFQFNGRLKKDFFSAEEKEALDDREYALCQHQILHGFSNRNIFHLLRQMCRDCT